MEELILKPEESIILQPGERIGAGEQPLRIRFGRVNEGTNAFKNIELMLWETMKRAHGNQTAVYRRGEEEMLIHVVPHKPQPDSFGFEEQTLTTTSRVFRIAKADLAGSLPKDDDTLTFDGKVYAVRKTQVSKTMFEDVGSYGVMMLIFVTEYRA